MNEATNPVEAIFAEALRQPGPAQRAAYLAAACGSDTRLRQRVEALLKAHDEAGNFMDPLAAPPAPPAAPAYDPSAADTIDGAGDGAGAGADHFDLDAVPRRPSRFGRESPLAEKPGSIIGHYKLLQKIGEGGFGVVWMADQEKPVRRRVALKIIKAGMDTKEVIARFEQERQALAMMDHPNIAKVLDAGSTDTGRPYFVMELVRGVKITDYCDEQGLSTTERIELFVTVCQAVQHAHHKGIIHRDLKPSNILVTVNDGQAVPKVIDFGVAKATQGRLTDGTLFTQFEQMIGTPLYMSPEQAEITSLDVDTRSDIYSLGVLLYELLTGRTPIDTATMAKAGMDEVRRLIREVDPPRPSARLKTLDGQELTTVAKRRHTEPARLSGSLRGDVDWIVMKCLEKDRKRRYDTANGLALDLQRHLKNEVVIARPPTAGYLLGKLVRRNKLAFAATAAVTLALVLGIVASLWQAARATKAKQDAQAETQRATAAEKLAGQRLSESEEARAEAEAISRFMQEVFFSQPEGIYSRNFTVAEALGYAVKRLEGNSTLPPVQRAKLQETVAITYFELGLPTEGLALREKAVAYYRTTFGPDDRKTLVAASGLMHSYRNAKRTDEAIKLGDDTLARMLRILGPDAQPTLLHVVLLTEAYADAGRSKEALAMREDLVPRMIRVLGPENYYTRFGIIGLASSYSQAGRHEEALKLREQVLASYLKKAGRENPFTLWAMGELASSYWDVGRRDEAIKLAEETAALMRMVLDPQHGWTATIEGRLAEWKAGRDGKPDFAATLKQLEEVSAKKPDDTISALRLATSQTWFGRDADHAATVRRTLDWAKDATKPDDLERVAKLACLRLIDNAPTREAALALARKAVDLGKENQAGMPWYRMTLGMAEYRSGHDAAAVEALTLAEAAGPSLADKRYRALICGTAGFYRAMSLSRQGKHAEARALFTATEAAMKPQPADDQNFLTGGTTHDDLILWLACKEARALLAQPGPPGK